MIWAGASGMLSLPYWVLVASGLLASNSLLWLDTTAIVTSMRNFPGERGSIAGMNYLPFPMFSCLLLKPNVGHIARAISVDFCARIQDNDSLDFTGFRTIQKVYPCSQIASKLFSHSVDLAAQDVQIQISLMAQAY